MVRKRGIPFRHCCGACNRTQPMTSHGPAHEPVTEASNASSASPDPPSLKLEEFLPYRLNVMAALVSQALSSIYADRYGIGVPEWRVLVTLGEFGMMTGKAVGAHSHMHKTKVSRAVALLEKRKLVARRVNRADMREAFLSLTPSGRAMYEELAPIALDFATRLFEVLDGPDRAAFDRAVRCLTARSAELAAEMAKRTEEE
jgi:DNA-binding MarR family transcriptional regulator